MNNIYNLLKSQLKSGLLNLLQGYFKKICIYYCLLLENSNASIKAKIVIIINYLSLFVSFSECICLSFPNCQFSVITTS